MRNVPLALSVLVQFLLVTLCFAQLAPEDPANRYDGALIGVLGGIGGNTRETPPGITGGTWATGTHTTGYAVGYRHDLTSLFSGAVTYVNHGHYDRHGYLTNHHSRDDLQMEILVRRRGGPVEFGVGGGPAYYSETDATGTGRDDFQNHHGFGLVTTGFIDVNLSSRLFIEGRVHRHLVADRFDSTNVLFGLGIRMQSSDQQEPTQIASGRKTFLRFSYGLGRMNGTRSETLRKAFQISQEVTLSKRFSLQASYLREGASSYLNRRGVALQGFAKQEFAGLLTLGLGLGPYINADRSDYFQRKDKVSVDALITALVDVRLTRRFGLSFSVGRPRSLTTLKNKPMTDVFQTGVKIGL